MYKPEEPALTAGALPHGRWSFAWRSVTLNVWYLGLTSLLTDVSSEMVASVLPIYLVVHLKLSPFAFGALDGLYNGVGAVTRWMSGVIADHRGRHKQVALAGYGISAACRLGLLAAGRAWTPLAAMIVLDRLGKGIRTAPRDALISLSTPSRDLAGAFGVHRAMDATGAMLGPVVAFLLIRLVPGRFDVVFVVSFSLAVVGLAVLAFFVEGVAGERSSEPAPWRASLRSAIALLRRHDFRTIVISASILALLTISDAFIYLVLMDRLRFSVGLFPLLAVGTAAAYLILAVPMGAVADQFGRSRVFLAGHGALLAVYGLLIVPSTYASTALASVVCLGAYYASTDGVLAALASAVLPATSRGSGLALLTTATSLARVLSSVAFGWLWTVWGQERAIIGVGLALFLGIAVARGTLGRSGLQAHD